MHLDDQIISSYLDNEVSSPWKEQLEEHIEWCPACQKQLEEARHLKTVINNAVLPQENIEASQKRVFSYIEKNILKKKKAPFKAIIVKPSFKKVFWPVLSAAVTFCFCLIIFNPGQSLNLIQKTPENISLSIESITPIRASDNYTTGKSLNDYSLEDIIQYLDKEGYDVSISTKGIKPLVKEPEVGTTKVFMGTGPRALLQNQSDFELFKMKFAFLFNY